MKYVCLKLISLGVLIYGALLAPAMSQSPNIADKEILERGFLAGSDGQDRDRYAPPSRAPFLRPELIQGHGIDICERVLGEHRARFLDQDFNAYILGHYQTASLWQLHSLVTRDEPDLKNWDGPPLRVEVLDYVHEGEIMPIGHLVQFEGLPNDIFFHLRVRGSWRGDKGAYYHIDAKHMSFDDFAGLLREDIAQIAKVRPPVHQDYTEWLEPHIRLYYENFILGDLFLIWGEDGDLFYRLSPEGTDIMSGRAIDDEGHPLIICRIQPPLHLSLDGQPNMSDALTQILPDKARLDLAEYFGLLSQAVGSPPIREGTMRSHSRLMLDAGAYRNDFYVRPWRVRHGYNAGPEVAARELRLWSYSAPRARKVYLDLIAAYPKAISATQILLRQAYGAPPPDLVGHSRAALNSVSAAHFRFRVRDETYGLQPSFIESIYEGEISTKEFLTGLDGVADKDLHNFIAASLFTPALRRAAIATGRDIEAPNIFGKTPLMVAAHLNLDEAAADLIAAGADIHASTQITQRGDINVSFSRTALNYAIENASMSLIEDLLESGAKIAPGRDDALEADLAINDNLTDVQRAVLMRRL